MKEFCEAKSAYCSTPIPAELSERLQAGLRQSREAYSFRKSRVIRRWFAAVACFAVLMVGLNLSPTLARAAANVPVLGRLFQVLTIVSYDTSEGGINYSVSIPKLEADGDMAEVVNAVIQEKIEQHLERAQKDWAEYQEAFFATGGTEEEWDGREMDVFVDYEIKRQTDTQVSFTVSLAEGWVRSMEERYYYNLDLAEDRDITLRDILGETWVETCNDAINEQIAASVDEEGGSQFFSPEEGGFRTVDEETSFYIREDGVPVVVFPRYAIAAGYMGFPEFPIPLP